jgi:uncharacterized integral membrane protein
MNAIFKMLAYLAMVILLVLIAYANADQRVNVTYFRNRLVEDVPVFLVILGSVFIGMLVAGVIAAFEHFKHGIREREAQRRIDALESEVRELRNLPIDRGPAESPDTDADGAEE